VKYLLTFLLLIPAGCHAMIHRHYTPAQAITPAVTLLHTFMSHPPLPSEMNITAEMNIPQKNGAKHVTKFLYLKQESDDLVPVTPGGLIAAHQNTESYDLDIKLQDIDDSGNAILMVIAHNEVEEKSFNGSVTLPLNASCTKTYPLPLSDENSKPITLTITSTIKK